ncbi:DUF3924 family protein [Ectobacillus panaciterrae]|uniref:DUF3924 family protein n=1 Tax=Ectobacillus panaciterrae TaxID=363872 RepID=UPI001FE1FA5A|nr:DUF3924 family protein [Ectobacillus panaciterrae]
MNKTAVTIELPKDIAEKLELLQQSYKKKQGVSITESTLIQVLISREFIREITPFDLNDYYANKEQH